MEKNEKSEMKPPGLFELEILQLPIGLIQGRDGNRRKYGQYQGKEWLHKGSGDY